MKRTATAVWNGSGKDGSGNLTTQSTTLNKTQYSFKSRFEQGVGTNPEELIAAAHAGCFLMKLSFVLGAAGFTPAESGADFGEHGGREFLWFPSFSVHGGCFGSVPKRTGSQALVKMDSRRRYQRMFR